MYLLTLDSEQADLVRDTLNGGLAFLRARKRRVDTENAISGAITVQASKIDNIFIQLSQGRLAQWAELPQDDQRTFENLASILAGEWEPAAKASAWDALLALALRSRTPEALDALADAKPIQTV